MKNVIDENKAISIESPDEEIVMEKIIELAPVSSKVNKDLYEKVSKKMEKDKKKGLKVSWRRIWEAGMTIYLKDKM